MRAQVAGNDLHDRCGNIHHRRRPFGPTAATPCIGRDGREGGPEANGVDQDEPGHAPATLSGRPALASIKTPRRAGACHDNAVAESFFSSLKRERIRRRTYRTREEARQDVFDYVEMFYNPVRKQVRNGMLSPVAFERQQVLKAEGV
jgi:hypothetical protein